MPLSASFSQLNRERMSRTADWLAVALAASLPWSTSATSVLVVLWLLAVLPTLDWPSLRRTLATPAGGLPVVLVALAVAGMAWADVTLIERWHGLTSFAKLLIVPLLIWHFSRSARGEQVFVAFLAACVALLLGSYLVTVYPEFPYKGSPDTGVIVKGYIIQSAEFTLCAAALLAIAIDKAMARRWHHAGAAAALALAFLLNMFFVATSRTTLVVIGVLALVYGARKFGWKGFVGAGMAGLALAAALWTASPYLRERVTGILSETRIAEAQNVRTPSGERIIFWTNSIEFIKSAPIIGHGTGSITEMFRRAAVGQTGARAQVSTNPHNQTFAVAIQLGLVGAAVLWAMWIAHLLVFRGAGLVEWIGLALVLQIIVGSLFNTFLFDFTEGWLYVLGFGVAAGTVQRKRGASGAPQAAGEPVL